MRKMIFQIGALFLLGSVSLNSALPPCVCTRNLKPVCGSDGITYSNECMLQCAQISNLQLFLERNGRCDGTSLGPPRNVRQAPVNCPCTLEYRPICGTDGRTYPNPCSLNCAKRSAPVDVAHPGACRRKREIGQVKDVDSQYCDGCIKESRHMCGTDGVTYKNPCILNCARENNEDLHIDYTGPCDSKLSMIDSLACVGCTRKVKPVCGTDGNNYRNPCMLNCARDKSEDLHIAHEGFCDSKVKVV